MAQDPRFIFECPTPYDENRIGAAAVYCSDGRMGEQMDEFLHQGLELPRYDRVACPGGPVCLSGRLMALWESRGVEDQLRFLIRVHQLKEVILIGHTGCAYYRDRLAIPEAKMSQEQRADLDRAAIAVRRISSSVEVSAYFAHRKGRSVRFEHVLLGGAPSV